MARSKSLVLNKDKEEEKKIKKEKKLEESKKNRKVNDKKKKELSDSEDEMFPKTEKEESGLPMFIKGTTWPMDTSVEVLVNYDAAKEMRKVRKEFYPLLFHMTRSDPRQMSTCICRSKVLLSYVKARMDQQSKEKTNKYGLSKELKNLALSPPPVSPKKTRKTVCSTAILTTVTDLTEAKTEILKLLARVSLKRQGFAQLLVWMQKLKLCGVHGAGRWGEVYVKDTTADDSSSTNSSSTDDDGGNSSTEDDEKISSSTKRGGYSGRGRGCRRGRGRGRGRRHIRNWKVALRPNSTVFKDKSSENSPKNVKTKSLTTTLPGNNTNVSGKKLKFHTWELKGKSIIKKDEEVKTKEENSENTEDKCFIQLVDVVSVLDKRIMNKNKDTSKSNRGRGRGRGRKRHDFENKNNEEDFVPNKKYRLSSGNSSTLSASIEPDIAVPMHLYRCDENENMSAPFVEIDNFENGVCVPYEDRFVAKELEVEQNILRNLQDNADGKQDSTRLVTHVSTSNVQPSHKVPSASTTYSPMVSTVMSSSTTSNPSRNQVKLATQIGPFSKCLAQISNQGNISDVVHPMPDVNVSSNTQLLPVCDSAQSQAVPRHYAQQSQTVPPHYAPQSQPVHYAPSQPIPAYSQTVHKTPQYQPVQGGSLSQPEHDATRSQPQLDVAQPLPTHGVHRPQRQLDVAQSQPENSAHQRQTLNDALKDALKIKIEQQSESYRNNSAVPSGIISISDGATMSFIRPTNTSLGPHEPTSSTNGNQEPKLDYVVVKNEINDYISLDSSDGEGSNNTRREANKTGTYIDDQKEADPIIVIDD